MSRPSAPWLTQSLALLPAGVFLASYAAAAQAPETAAELFDRHAAAWLGVPAIGATRAPLVLAAGAALVVLVAQMMWLGLRRRSPDAMLLVNLLPMAVFVAASLWFSPATFALWMPSVLCWSLGLGLWMAQALAGRNLLRGLLAGAIALPDRTWHRLHFAWVAFFAGMGLVHLWAAYTLGAADWDGFKRFGGLAAVLVFGLGQAGVLGLQSRHTGHRRRTP
jgi:intracellular septation protein A